MFPVMVAAGVVNYGGFVESVTPLYSFTFVIPQYGWLVLGGFSKNSGSLLVAIQVYWRT